MKGGETSAHAELKRLALASIAVAGTRAVNRAAGIEVVRWEGVESGGDVESSD